MQASDWMWLLFVIHHTINSASDAKCCINRSLKTLESPPHMGTVALIRVSTGPLKSWNLFLSFSRPGTTLKRGKILERP